MAPADPSQVLDELFKESAGDLSRYFARRHDAADLTADLVQETFLHMARVVKDGRPLKCARGYLFGIARHLSLAAWSRKKNETALTLDDNALQVAAPVRDERVNAARETIAALPALQREILELRFIQNLSYQEIAEALGIPVGTVRSRLHHAVSALRERLASESINLPNS